mmetsp:Transcript_61701/g.151880  ORF Transcript_61701/g.151880 Transcript_61701/m.151880 type:complete len:146 (+) Transcript_61701:114-551(+)
MPGGEGQALQGAPHGAKAAEVYGIVGYLLSTVAFILWTVWAYTPDWVFHSLSITYYPDRYWAAAVPIYLFTLLIYLIILYNAKNLMSNEPFESYITIRDSEEEANEREEDIQVFEQSYTIPPAADISIRTINKMLFNSLAVNAQQ